VRVRTGIGVPLQKQQAHPGDTAVRCSEKHTSTCATATFMKMGHLFEDWDIADCLAHQLRVRANPDVWHLWLPHGHDDPVDVSGCLGKKGRLFAASGRPCHCVRMGAVEIAAWDWLVSFALPINVMLACGFGICCPAYGATCKFDPSNNGLTFPGFQCTHLCAAYVKLKPSSGFQCVSGDCQLVSSAVHWGLQSVFGWACPWLLRSPLHGPDAMVCFVAQEIVSIVVNQTDARSPL
jgi:hypothetical protein